MKINRYFERIDLSPASLNGQWIVAAPKAYFAKQSMERKRNCGKPGFCHRQKWPQKKEIVWYNKNHRLELIDEDGNQGGRIEIAEGKTSLLYTDALIYYVADKKIFLLRKLDIII